MESLIPLPLALHPDPHILPLCFHDEKQLALDGWILTEYVVAGPTISKTNILFPVFRYFE